MIGQKFHKLLVLKQLTRRKLFVLCDCGKQLEIYASRLESGKIKSCGCYNLELIRERGLKNKKHGHSRRIEPKSRAYKTWCSMIRRCHTTSASGYYKYGAKGISVSDEWRNSFENFLNDMGNPPDGMSLDRIDPWLGYFKDNCKWSTPKEQARNKKNNKKYTINGVTKCLAYWVEETGIKYATALARLSRGIPIDVAIKNEPIRRKKD